MVPGVAFTTPQQFSAWLNSQSWLYTKRDDFGEFDLHLEYWTKSAGNSGVSIRDTSRAKCAITIPVHYTKTPSKIRYEIQINNRYPDPHPSGSIYGFVDAPKDAQHDDDWNAMDISLRHELALWLVSPMAPQKVQVLKSARSLSMAFQYTEISLVPLAVSEAVVRVFLSNHLFPDLDQAAVCWHRGN
jgi:hypothetical protein